MALPTVPHYWTTRKNMYEQAIVRQRTHLDDFRQKWGNTADYWHKNNIDINKKKHWESDDSLRESMDAYRADKDKDLKTQKLQKRRLKLAALLKHERDQWEAELKGLSKDNYARLEDMKDRAESLRSAREEKRQQIRDEKLYEFWKKNNPELRKVEQEMFKEHVIHTWSGQVKENKEKLDKEREEKEEYERQLEEERREALQKQRRQKEEKLREERRFRDILKEQMMELKEREIETERLKKQQEDLVRQQWALDRLEEEREKREAERTKREHGRLLLRQHKAQMMRRSKQIMEELEMDKRLLEAMIEKVKEEETVRTERKEQARADAAWMKQVIEEQIKVEKAREAELDMLYQDEAARMWQKRDAEWEREKRARERLMKENQAKTACESRSIHEKVLSTRMFSVKIEDKKFKFVMEDRQRQIEDRLEENKERQEESLQQREQLLREMEIANQLTRREQEEAEDEKKEFKLNLQEQMSARRERETSARRRMEEELDEEMRADQEHEELLAQETQRMRLRGFNPKDYGRRQAWS